MNIILNIQLSPSYKLKRTVIISKLCRDLTYVSTLIHKGFLISERVKALNLRGSITDFREVEELGTMLKELVEM